MVVLQSERKLRVLIGDLGEIITNGVVICEIDHEGALARARNKTGVGPVNLHFPYNLVERVLVGGDVALQREPLRGLPKHEQTYLGCGDVRIELRAGCNVPDDVHGVYHFFSRVG